MIDVGGNALLMNLYLGPISSISCIAPSLLLLACFLAASSHYLLLYFATAAIVNKWRRNISKQLIEVI